MTERNYNIEEMVNTAKGYASYKKVEDIAREFMKSNHTLGGIGIDNLREGVKEFNGLCVDNEVKKELVPYINDLEHRLCMNYLSKGFSLLLEGNVKKASSQLKFAREIYDNLPEELQKDKSKCLLPLEYGILELEKSVSKANNHSNN